MPSYLNNCEKVHKNGYVYAYSMNIMNNYTRLENLEIKQVTLIHYCDLLALVNTCIKHSDSFLVSGKVHKAQKPHQPKQLPSSRL